MHTHFRAFLEKIFEKKFTLHLFGIETPKRNLFLRKKLKIGKKYARREWRAFVCLQENYNSFYFPKICVNGLL